MLAEFEGHRAMILGLFHKDLALTDRRSVVRAVISIIALRFGNAAMDTLQEKQEELQLLRQHCAWFGMRGDLAMQRQLAMECDGIAVEIDLTARHRSIA